MGSASSRMSANPALVHSSEEASSPSTGTTSSVTPEPALAHESDLSINNQTSESEHVSPPTQALDHTISPVKLDKGKGKAKQVMDDKEEGEISEDEVDAVHVPQHASPLATRRSSVGKVHYDSYRPTPRGSSRPPNGSQSPKSFRPPSQPRQYKQQSQSPLQMQFPQHTHHGQHHQHVSRVSGDLSHKSSLPLRSSPVASTSQTRLPAKPVPINDQAMTPELVQPAAVVASSPPEDSLALPSILTSEEAEQYMAIIRNLMQDGVRPDVLIKRGATPKYVSMVCREIVEGSRKRKEGSLWTETREPDTAITPDIDAGPSTLPSGLQSPTLLRSGLRSPSLNSVDMTRDRSISSISSVETSIEVERMILPEQPIRLVPTSSWAPANKALPSPVRVESYRPTRSAVDYSDIVPSRPTRAIQPVANLNIRLGTRLPAEGLPRPVSSYVPPKSTNPLRSRASDLSPVVKRPTYYANNGQTPKTPPLPGSPVVAKGPQPHIAPTPIAHGASGGIVSLGDHEMAPLADAITIPVTAPTVIPAPALPRTSISTNGLSSAMNALLESKRRAMESMKRGRKASKDVPSLSARPLTPPLDNRASLPSPPPVPPVLAPVAASQENLEDQVAALEQEVLGLQEAAPKPVDDQEEGEIPDEIEPPVQPRMAAIVPSTAPVQLNKSTKRPNAEDMMDYRTSSISSRSAHPAKRRLFGAPLRMKRLLVSLDDDDDDSEDETSTPTPTAAEMEVERKRLLQEKDDNIMRLREQILRLQARANRDKKDKAKEAAAQAAVVESMPALVDAVTEDVEMSQSPEDSPEDERPETPALPTVPLVETPALPTGPLAPTDDADHQEIHTVIADEGNENNMDLDPEDQHHHPETTPMRTPQLSTSSTSTNGDSTVHLPVFSPYRPLLDRYPQLASSSSIKSSLSRFDWPAAKNQAHHHFDPTRLSSIILTRRMQQDPNAVVCGAEAAGGSCADPTCSDIHLGRDLDRPHDEELIEYISEISDVPVDIATIQQGLIQAKKQLGISDHSSRSKKKNTEAGYSMSIAEQLMVFTEKLLQDDRSTSAGTGHVLV